jgi:prophage regulatory protein
MKRAPRYLREQQVLARVPFSRPTLHRRVKAGTFPRPVKVGQRSIAWIEHEIDEWDARLVAERDAGAERDAPSAA